MATADISVCVCTHRRPRELGALLGSLSALPLRPFHEVIIAGALCERPRSVDSRTKMRIFEGARDAGSNRNVALFNATGRFVLFLDDDVVASSSFAKGIESACARLDSAPSAPGVVGSVLPTVVGSLDRAWDRAGFNRFFALPTVADRLRWGATANLLVRTRAARRIDGFSSVPFGAGGEDIDFGMRLTSHHALISAPELAVVHTAFDGPYDALLARAFRYGQSEQWLATRYVKYASRSVGRDIDATGDRASDRLLEAFDAGGDQWATESGQGRWTVSPTTMALATSPFPRISG